MALQASASPEPLLPFCTCTGLGPKFSGGCLTLQPTSPWTPAMLTICAGGGSEWLGEATYKGPGFDCAMPTPVTQVRVCVASSTGTSRISS